MQAALSSASHPAIRLGSGQRSPHLQHRARGALTTWSVWLQEPLTRSIHPSIGSVVGGVTCVGHLRRFPAARIKVNRLQLSDFASLPASESAPFLATALFSFSRAVAPKQGARILNPQKKSLDLLNFIRIFPDLIDFFGFYRFFRT